MHGPSVCRKAVVGKVSRKWKGVFCAFRIWKRHMIRSIGIVMWQMLRVYEVGGKLLKAVPSFYVDSIGRVSGGDMM